MRETLHKCIMLTLLLLLFPTQMWGNSNYYFKHIDSNVGLSSNNVKCISMDSYGFMWFGTKNGLCRFDGIFTRQFDCYDYETNKGNNNIGALYEDSNNNLWVGTDRGIYIYNPITDKFKFVGAKDKGNGTYAENWVQSICGDNKNGVWALLPDQGIFHYTNEDKVDFYHITSSFKKQYPTYLYMDTTGNVWVCTIDAGIFKYNYTNRKFERIVTKDGNSLLNNRFSYITEDADGHIIFGEVSGVLYEYDAADNSVTTISYKSSGNINLRCMQCFDNEIWIGTQSGVIVVDQNNNSENILYSNPTNRFSLSDDAIYTIYKSESGDAWIGTFFGGANYMPRNKFKFEVYGLGSEISSKRIRCLAQAPDGQIWIGTEDQGLNILNPKTKTIKQLSHITSHKKPLILHAFGDKMYAGFTQEGLETITPDGVFTHQFPINGPDNSVYAYIKDSKGNEWIGLSYSLYCRKAGSSEYIHITEVGYDWIFSLYEGSDGSIWIGTMGNGIWKYTPGNGTYKKYEYNEKKPNGLRSNCVSAIMEDNAGNIWLSTDRGGISRYNKSKDDFTSFGVPEGLPDEVAYDILEDNNGFLWFGTNKGLVKFNPKNLSVKVFTSKDGIPGNQFNYHSALKASNKLFYFGGIEGMIAFNPEMEDKQAAPAPIYFTRLSILNEDINASMKDSPLDKNIMFTDRIEIPYDKATFSLDVVSPNFGIIGEGEYSYRLMPINKEWISLSNNNISFSNLAPGTYKLEVQITNHGSVSQRTLTIVILPPWWSSTWAYWIYALLIIAVIALWFRWYRNHKNKQLRERQQLFAINKEKELYSNKVKFFSEIAHEIHTPLTLIDAPLEALEEINLKNDKADYYVKVMRQNTKRLLDLTGHLLDFQKIDSKKLTLKYENIDIVSLINDTIARFEPTYQIRNKELISEIEPNSLIVSIDKEAVTKILSNLLNNALKYSRHKTNVELKVFEKEFRIKVFSDGEPIAVADKERIFERFYQIDTRKDGEDGVGIGLPLSRSLAMILNGSLTLENYDNIGNTFVVTLPLIKENIDENNETTFDKTGYVMEEESNLSKDKTNGYTILLVEDNDTMREFIAEQLAHSFTVETAVDGEDALNKLKDIRVDLIVTDIMMPKMDGYALCQAVKEDFNLSHTPVVFITAKNDLESKIKGLQYGAEAYIEKPFSLKYFKQQLNSLLDNRRREREAFSKKPFFMVDNMQNNKADEEFMNKVVKIIEEHICEENFNVETMADIFCMSRSSLLRKIKTLFNLLPVELIRLIKLKKAAKLIQEGEHRIGDICYMVGISSPSYFSKLFFKQFGITPKDFEKQYQKGNNRSEKSDDIDI